MSVFTFIADSIVEQVDQYKKQGDQCERVIEQIRTGMNPLQAGGWKGQGANSYFQEILTRVIPQIAELIAAIAGFGGNMGKALNIMMNADKMVSGVVNQVADAFDSIF